MPKGRMSRTHYRRTEISQMTGLSVRQIDRMIRNGDIDVEQLVPGGVLLVTASSWHKLRTAGKIRGKQWAMKVRKAVDDEK